MSNPNPDDPRTDDPDTLDPRTVDPRTVDPGAKAYESLHESDPNASGPDGLAGDMGVSSERTGEAGGTFDATNGRQDTSEIEAATDAAGVEAPEQKPGGFEPKPVGLKPKADPPG